MLRSRWVVVWWVSNEGSVVDRVGGGRSSSGGMCVATRWSLMYRSAWSSMSEFPYEDGGCPGPEVREYVES